MSVERDVLDRMERLGIRHFVTGSWALSVHAEPRMTRDLDLVLDLDPAEYDRLIRPAFEDVYLVNDVVDGGGGAMGGGRRVSEIPSRRRPPRPMPDAP